MCEKASFKAKILNELNILKSFSNQHYQHLQLQESLFELSVSVNLNKDQ